MSRVDKFIKEIAPEGVRHAPVGEAVIVLPTARGIKREHYSSGSLIPIVDQGQSRIAGYTDDRLSAVPGGEYIVFGEHTRAIKWVDFEFAPGADGTKVLIATRGLLPRFAYYALSNLEIPSRGYNRHWTVLRELKIPIPPINIQREIIRILDQFSDLEANLEAELEAELEARRHQYAYYQNLVFANIAANDSDRVSLRDVGQWYGGGTPSKGRPDYWNGGTIPWISPKDMGETIVTRTEDYITEQAVVNSSTKLVPKNSVAIVARSSILNHTLPVAFVPVPAALNQDMKAVIARDGISPRYLFHALRASRGEILRRVRRAGGSVASLDSRKLWQFDIPVPSRDEQERVVKLLDRFDSLMHDLSINLPTELAARRKQYEYYRDRLLTFEEATV